MLRKIEELGAQMEEALILDNKLVTVLLYALLVLFVTGTLSTLLLGWLSSGISWDNL